MPNTKLTINPVVQCFESNRARKRRDNEQPRRATPGKRRRSQTVETRLDWLRRQSRGELLSQSEVCEV